MQEENLPLIRLVSNESLPVLCCSKCLSSTSDHFCCSACYQSITSLKRQETQKQRKQLALLTISPTKKQAKVLLAHELKRSVVKKLRLRQVLEEKKQLLDNIRDKTRKIKANKIKAQRELEINQTYIWQMRGELQRVEQEGVQLQQDRLSYEGLKMRVEQEMCGTLTCLRFFEGESGIEALRNEAILIGAYAHGKDLWIPYPISKHKALVCIGEEQELLEYQNREAEPNGVYANYLTANQLYLQSRFPEDTVIGRQLHKVDESLLATGLIAEKGQEIKQASRSTLLLEEDCVLFDEDLAVIRSVSFGSASSEEYEVI